MTHEFRQMLPDVGHDYSMSDAELINIKNIGKTLQDQNADSIVRATESNLKSDSVLESILQYPEQMHQTAYTYAKLEYQERLARLREIMKSGLMPPPAVTQFFIAPGVSKEVYIPERSVIMQTNFAAGQQAYGAFSGNINFNTGDNGTFVLVSGQYFLVDNVSTFSLMAGAPFNISVSFWREAQFL
jgi:hypothetical protein